MPPKRVLLQALTFWQAGWPGAQTHHKENQDHFFNGAGKRVHPVVHGVCVGQYFYRLQILVAKTSQTEAKLTVWTMSGEPDGQCGI